jgi:ATP-dependent DNA helicase RecG
MRFKESETVELKQSTSALKEAIISIGAMLNKHGKATVYFGIDDTGAVLGQQIGKSTVKDISKAISDWIEPKVFPDIQIKKISGKNCIVVNVSGHDAVYSARGRYYLRVGEEDKRLSVNELKRLVEKKSNYIYSWGFDVSDLTVSKADVPTIKSFVAKGRKAGRIEYAYDSARNVLNKLHLVKGKKLLSAGKALFCKDNRVEVRAAVFATDEKTTFLDIQSFQGTLFDLIAQCETYVKERINWRAKIVDFKRIETPEVPIAAIREAIVNSLCHRDFNNPSGNELAIYRNRIEIYNPGQFPYDHSPEEFIKGTEKSIPRNPLIADTFYFAKDIERWGSGFKRIVDECKAAGVKVTFENIKTGFVVTFYRPKVGTTLQKAEKGEGVNEGVNEGVKLLVEYIRMNPGQRVPSISKATDIAPKTLERWLGKLKNDGKVIFKGSAKTGGYWEAVK